MIRHSRIAVIITSTERETISAWMEVRDHGMDLRFYYRDTERRIPEQLINSWDLDRETQ